MSLKRIYELMFVLVPETAEEEVDKIIEQVSQIIIGKGGEVSTVEKMGRRTLAYEIQKGSQKFRDGYYILLNFIGSGEEIAEIERRLRVLDPVLRYITVRLDEELKRVKKMQVYRAARAAARPYLATNDDNEEESSEDHDHTEE